MLFSPQALKCISLFILSFISTYNNSTGTSGYGFFQELENYTTILNPYEFKVESPILATQTRSYNEVHQEQGKPPLSKKSRCLSFVLVNDTKTNEHEIIRAQNTNDFIHVSPQNKKVSDSMLQLNNKKRKRLSIVAHLSKFFCSFT